MPVNHAVKKVSSTSKMIRLPMLLIVWEKQSTLVADGAFTSSKDMATPLAETLSCMAPTIISKVSLSRLVSTRVIKR